MRASRQSIGLCAILAVVMFLQGCSVQMAARGRTSPDMDLINVGLDRRYVISLVGDPDVVEETPNGVEEIYYLHDEEKGWRYARATLYAFLDVATFGLWELLGTPLEEFIQSKNTLTIRYGKDNKIESFIKEVAD